MNKDIRAIMIGHMISLNKKQTKLKKFGDLFYRTNHWGVIIGKKQVSFKQANRYFKIKYEDVKTFFLKDSETFVFILHSTNNKFKFKIT